MAVYYCKEHDAEFFKKGKMKRLAHPIGDTGTWCNMPEGQEPEPEAPPPPVAKDGMTPELWAEKDRAQAHSIETQVAFKGIIDLLTAKIIGVEGDYAFKALDWAIAHLQTDKTTTAPTQKSQSTPPERATGASQGEKAPLLSTDGKSFKNVGELFTEAQKIGVPRQKVLDMCRVKSSNDLTDLAGAWELVKDYKENNEENTNQEG